MRKRLLAWGICALLLSGCSSLFPYEYPNMLPSPSPSPPPPPIVLPSPAPKAHMFGIAFSPVGRFQPLTDTLRYNDQAARLCYEGLFELDGAFTPQPLLCTAMTTDDNRTFRFTLREGVLFHDGSPLTAADVAYSIGLARRPGGPYGGRLACVQSVSAHSDGSVAVVTDRPVWNAAALFDFPIVRESADAVAPGTGPYRVVFAEEGDYLLPSGVWWQDTPLPVERIDLIAVESADTLVYSFQYGYIAMLPADPWDTFAPGISSGYEKVAVPSGLLQYIGLNTGRKPLDQPALREALALALDRRGAAGAVYGADAVAAALPVPPASPFYLQAGAMRYRYAPGESARIIADLGYTRLDLDMIVSAENAARVRMAEACAASFRNAGFAVTVRALDWNAFEAALLNGDYDLYYAEARPAPNFSPLDFILPDGPFAYGVADSAALREAAALLDAAGPYTPEGDAALEAVWDALYDEMPLLTVCFRDTLFISQRGLLSGQTPTFYNPYYHWTDWTVTRE